MKKIGIAIIMSILLMNIALAATTPTNTQSGTAVSLTEIETKQLFIQENAKTIAAIKQYIDTKTLEYEIYTKKEIESNFMVLDSRISKFTRDAGIKLGAIFFSGIIFGGLILIYINRQLKKKTIVKRELIDQRMNERIKILEDDLKRIRIRAQQDIEEREAKKEQPKKKSSKKKKEETLQPPTPPAQGTMTEPTKENTGVTPMKDAHFTTERERALLQRIEALEAQNKPTPSAEELQKKAQALKDSIKAQYAELQALEGPKKKERRGLFRRKKKAEKTKWSDA